MATMYDDTVTFNLRKTVGKLYVSPAVGENTAELHLVLGVRSGHFYDSLRTFNLTQDGEETFEVGMDDARNFRKVKFRPEDKNDKSLCLTKYGAHVLADYEVKKGIEPKASRLEKITQTKIFFTPQVGSIENEE
jgi:hypothetical protein